MALTLFIPCLVVLLPQGAALVRTRGSIDQPSQPDAPQSCPENAHRKFEFRDPLCGNRTYDLEQCMTVFAAEQAYWSEQGSSNPWWAVLTDRPKGLDIPLEEKLRFYDSGIGEVELMKSLFTEHKMEPVWAGQALDLGCGLGRMSNALSTLGFEKVLCVDQAPSFLSEAHKSLRELEGQGNISRDVLKRVKFLYSSPDLSCQVKPGTLDFVHSILTLQHMKPHLQVAYIEQMCDALKVNGTGYVGIPVDIHDEFWGYKAKVHCSIHWDLQTMMMHYTEEKEIVRHLNSRGCSVVGVVDRNDIGEKFGAARRFLFRKT